ncbi:hypothetical protein AVEN_99027-1 [Araneus ventricosus]|uniref:Uncharacterized protein n=1 Tax=Araneus ventricosus TaxID=182803 RepID=A0A4Y2ND81_ARAVE|nr:hypothetical protein AVEN_99027-1 [Araneus ventricosus]
MRLSRFEKLALRKSQPMRRLENLHGPYQTLVLGRKGKSRCEIGADATFMSCNHIIMTSQLMFPPSSIIVVLFQVPMVDASCLRNTTTIKSSYKP